MEKKTKALIAISTLLALASCGAQAVQAGEFIPANPFWDKEVSNHDFENPNDIVSADFEIDGVLDNPEWEQASLNIVYGKTDVVDAEIHAMVYWGKKGLSIGFYSYDKYIASSTNYSDSLFVINSDNVEFYIDTKNDKGPHPKSDDYAFLVNPEGFILPWNGTDVTWSHCSGIVDYATHVDGTINDDSDIDTGWSTEIFIPYSNYGITEDSTISVAFGARDKTTNLLVSDWCGWIPDPQVPDTFVSLNKEGTIAKKVGGYGLANGEASYDEATESFTSTKPDALLFKPDGKFEEGTIKTNVTFDEVNSDNGIVFGLDHTSSIFWEDSSTSYYFFFLNRDGNAYLGKTEYGSWREIAVVPDVAERIGSANELKVILTQGYAFCFLNGDMLINTKVDCDGDGIGLRLGGTSVKATKITQSDDTGGIIIDPALLEYNIAAGSFEKTASHYHACALKDTGAMLIKDKGEFKEGTLSMNVMPNGVAADNGLVFGLDARGKTSFWEQDVDYYFAFVNRDGNLLLGHVSDTGWSTVRECPIEGYSPTGTYDLSVSLDGYGNIYISLNGLELLGYYDSNIAGAAYGVRVGSTACEFDLPVLGK